MPDGTYPGAGERVNPGAAAPISSPPDAAPRDPEAALADALSVIDGLDDLPPAEHVARFEHVHDALRAHLNGDS